MDMARKNDTNEKNSVEKLTAWMEELEGTPLEELREIRREMGHDVGGDEQKFLSHLRELNNRLQGAHQPAEQPFAEDEPTIPQPVRGLIAEAKARGLSGWKLADTAQLSIALVTKLDRRLIRYASIPRQVIEDIAGALQCGAQRVAAYLQGRPLLPNNAYFKADETPSVPEQQDFFDEVLEDDSLSEERRQRLLAMKG